MRLPLKDLTGVRKNLHFAAVFLNTVWEVTRGKRTDRQEELLVTALDNVQDLRHDYDQAWKEQAESEGLLEVAS